MPEDGTIVDPPEKKPPRQRNNAALRDDDGGDGGNDDRNGFGMYRRSGSWGHRLVNTAGIPNSQVRTWPSQQNRGEDLGHGVAGDEEDLGDDNNGSAMLLPLPSRMGGAAPAKPRGHPAKVVGGVQMRRRAAPKGWKMATTGSDPNAGLRRPLEAWSIEDLCRPLQEGGGREEFADEQLALCSSRESGKNVPCKKIVLKIIDHVVNYLDTDVVSRGDEPREAVYKRARNRAQNIQRQVDLPPNFEVEGDAMYWLDEEEDGTPFLMAKHPDEEMQPFYTIGNAGEFALKDLKIENPESERKGELFHKGKSLGWCSSFFEDFEEGLSEEGAAGNAASPPASANRTSSFPASAFVTPRGASGPELLGGGPGCDRFLGDIDPPTPGAAAAAAKPAPTKKSKSQAEVPVPVEVLGAPLEEGGDRRRLGEGGHHGGAARPEGRSSEEEQEGERRCCPVHTLTGAC